MAVETTNPIVAADDPPPPPVMVVCRLPSGVETITTYESCIADGGEVRGKVIDDSAKTPTPGITDELFLYRTPNGNGVIGTYEDAQKDKGTIQGKLQTKVQLGRS